MCILTFQTTTHMSWVHLDFWTAQQQKTRKKFPIFLGFPIGKVNEHQPNQRKARSIPMTTTTNNVLLVKIDGPGAGIPSIIIETCCYSGVSSNPIQQPTNGNLGHL